MRPLHLDQECTPISYALTQCSGRMTCFRRPRNYRPGSKDGRLKALCMITCTTLSSNDFQSPSASHRLRRLTSPKIFLQVEVIFSFWITMPEDPDLGPLCFSIAPAKPSAEIRVGSLVRRHDQSCAGPVRRRIWVP